MITAMVGVVKSGEKTVVEKMGNGRLDAVCECLADYFDTHINITLYTEHALTVGSDSSAIAYVGITDEDTGNSYYGAGIDPDIMRASIDALVSAVNRKLSEDNK